MTEVGGNIKELEGIVQSKTNNVRVIEQGSSSNAISSSPHTMVREANPLSMKQC